MKYYYTDGTNKFGPMSVEKLLICDINAKTLVWYDGMTEWIPAGEVPEIAEALKSVPPPIPKPEREPEPTPAPTPEAPTMPTPPERPKTWLVESILVTIFCFLPLGIIALIHAWQVDEYYNKRDYDLAIKYSDSAKRWCKYGLIAALVFWAIPIILLFILGFSIWPMMASVISMIFTGVIGSPMFF